jgi:hypothetical protein
MKKKAPARTTVKKTAPKTRSRKSSSVIPVITIHRFLIVSAVVIAFLSVALVSLKPNVTQSVAGLSIARPLYAEATVGWEPVQGAASYNIYYKEESEPDYTNAVRNIPANVTKYTISYLKKSGKYVYKVSAADSSGNEFLWSGAKVLTNLQGM